MGYRTTIILFNDQAGEWSADALLGKKISTAMSHATDRAPSLDASLGYGRVVECVHADQQSLAVLECYNFTRLASGHWHPGQKTDAAHLELLKQAAEKLGYRLVKQSVK